MDWTKLEQQLKTHKEMLDKRSAEIREFEDYLRDKGTFHIPFTLDIENHEFIYSLSFDRDVGNDNWRLLAKYKIDTGEIITKPVAEMKFYQKIEAYKAIPSFIDAYTTYLESGKAFMRKL